MISVIIPTLNSEATLAQCLSALVPAAVDGFVREVLIPDGGSSDATLRIVDTAGADLIAEIPNRCHQLRAGAQAARARWLLFLPAEAVLTSGCEREAMALIARQGDGYGRATSAAVFGFALDETGAGVRMFETAMRTVTDTLGFGSGGGGVLISRPHFQSVGGFDRYAPLPEVDLVRRVGRRRLTRLKSRLVYNAGSATPLTTSVSGRAGELLAYRLQTAMRRFARPTAAARA